MLDFLGSQAPVDMLELFCRNPDESFFSKEIGERLGLSKATTIKWLKKLTERGILIKRSRGRKTYYQLKWGNTLSRQIRVLLTVSELVSVLENISDLKGTYLVGDSARGTDSPDSPIELLILNRGDSRRIESVLDEVSERIGREIDADIMTPLEYSELARDKPKVHEKLEREKIRLTFPGKGL